MMPKDRKKLSELTPEDAIKEESKTITGDDLAKKLPSLIKETENEITQGNNIIERQSKSLDNNKHAISQKMGELRILKNMQEMLTGKEAK